MAIVYQQKFPDGLTIGVWETSESSDELLNLVHITEDEKAVVNGFKLENRKKEWLAVRALLKHFAGDGQTISYTKEGKPYLVRQKFQIGVTHTPGYAALILHPTKPVAIDIERPSGRALSVADRYLAKEEAQLPHHFSEELFATIVWCSKEAMFKWWSESEVTFKEQLRVKNILAKENQEVEIESTLSKDDEVIDLPLHCCINHQYVLVYTR